MSYPPMGYSGAHGDEDWREDDSEREEYDEGAKEEYEAWLDAQDERDLPPHKRKGYAEQMAEIADRLNDAERENLK